MGIGFCDKCVKKYYPKRWGTGTSPGWASASCEKCGAFWVRGYYGGLEGLEGYERQYRIYAEWLSRHRKKMGKRKGKFRKINKVYLNL